MRMGEVTYRLGGFAALVLAALLSATLSARAEGLDCAKAREVERRGEGVLSTAQTLLREVSDIYGLGLLSEWTRGKLAVVKTPSGTADAGWEGDWITHPFDPETGAPNTRILGGLQLRKHFGQHWLVWQVDASEPCEGRSYVPVMLTADAVLRLDTDLLYQAIVERVPFGGAHHAPEDSQALAQIWEQALPILSSVTLTRDATTCSLTYQTPDAPVSVSFFCTPLSGG